ncbi:tRNA 2-selenouridine(34) synthase MnmH [Hyphococcus sp. DH-69]|uniref:tRNA 2-selenouridine(34) synthase MnmH n=1 Tax=Hyphococcus formosus TaxID=3143534 RepID=UPI00398B4263
MGAILQPHPPPWAKLVNRGSFSRTDKISLLAHWPEDSRTSFCLYKQGGIRKGPIITAAIHHITETSLETLAQFDAIIDVRSPAEFAEDHIPGAINLPVLDDAQRAEVGTIYKQVSRFKARRIGAGYVAKNVAHHLETALSDKPAKFHPLIYCWRGGMRSNAMATILTQVGWRTGLLRGGYKTWRRSVVAGLRDSDDDLPLILLDGQTGTAKSDILRTLTGVQTIDLEARANHRGSVFGGYSGTPQPHQKYFESLLWFDLQHHDLSRPILLEAESNRIGRCEIPKRIWNAMRRAPRISLTAPVPARVDYLMNAYADITSDQRLVDAALSRLRPFHPKDALADWMALAEAKDYRTLAAALIEAHYDPLYGRSRKKDKSPTLAQISLPDLSTATFETVAKEIALVLSKAENKEDFHG